MTDDPTTTPVLSAEQIAADDADVFLVAGKPSAGATITRDEAGRITTIVETPKEPTDA